MKKFKDSPDDEGRCPKGLKYCVRVKCDDKICESHMVEPLRIRIHNRIRELRELYGSYKW